MMSWFGLLSRKNKIYSLFRASRKYLPSKNSYPKKKKEERKKGIKKISCFNQNKLNSQTGLSTQNAKNRNKFSQRFKSTCNPKGMGGKAARFTKVSLLRASWMAAVSVICLLSEYLEANESSNWLLSFPFTVAPLVSFL